MEVEEILWRMYNENTTNARHHEMQRTTVTGFVILTGSALVGFITYDKVVAGIVDSMVSIALIFTGLLGALFVMKHFERFRLHMSRANAYRDLIDQSFIGRPLAACERLADERHDARWQRLARLKATYWWAMLNLLFTALGLVLLGFSIVNPSPASTLPTATFPVKAASKLPASSSARGLAERQFQSVPERFLKPALSR